MISKSIFELPYESYMKKCDHVIKTLSKNSKWVSFFIDDATVSKSIRELIILKYVNKNMEKIGIKKENICVEHENYFSSPDFIEYLSSRISMREIERNEILNFSSCDRIIKEYINDCHCGVWNYEKSCFVS